MVNDTAKSFDRVSYILSEIPFFEDFSDEELVLFSNQLSLRLFPEQSCLFKKDDVGDYLVFIVNGKLDVRLESNDKKQMIIASFGPGNTVGEMSLIDDYPRSATVVVTEPSELLLLSRKRFDEICSSNPVIGLKFLRGLAQNLSVRLRKTNGRFADFD